MVRFLTKVRKNIANMFVGTLVAREIFFKKVVDNLTKYKFSNLSLNFDRCLCYLTKQKIYKVIIVVRKNSLYKGSDYHCLVNKL